TVAAPVELASDLQTYLDPLAFAQANNGLCSSSSSSSSSVSSSLSSIALTHQSSISATESDHSTTICKHTGPPVIRKKYGANN
ncbi:hypothetical protein CPB97_002229, partial [Podila verticillata]